MKKKLTLSSLLSLFLIIFICVQPVSAASQADIAYANAYEATISAQNSRTQKSINIARTAINSLTNTSAYWAIGEFSHQVDLIQQPILVKVVQAILTAKADPVQANINIAKFSIDVDLPTEWRSSYSSAVDIIQQELMTRAINATNNAAKSKSATDIDYASYLISDIQTSADPSIVNWANSIEQQLNSYITTITNVDEFNSAIENALENFNSDITLEIQNYDSSIYNSDIINTIINDNPILDYGYTSSNWKTTWTGNGINRTMNITLNYSKTKAEMQMMKTAAKQKSDEILGTIIKPNMTDIQKELAIHDYIVNHARYDIENYNTNTIPTESYTDYGILVKGVGVCEGYAKAMYRLLNSAGVKCLYITGTADGEPHAWNKVLIDGTFYNVDTTWDDPVTTDGRNILSHDYFNVTDVELSKDHTW